MFEITEIVQYFIERVKLREINASNWSEYRWISSTKAVCICVPECFVIQRRYLNTIEYNSEYIFHAVVV